MTLNQLQIMDVLIMSHVNLGATESVHVGQKQGTL